MEVEVSLASTLLDVALDSLKDSIKSEIALHKGLQTDLAFIKEELEMMQAFLATAHGGRGRSQVVKAWTKQVANIAYQVEYSLNRFDVRRERSSALNKFGGKLRRLLLPSVGFIQALPARHDVGVEIKELKSRVQEVSLRNSRYWLIDNSANNGAASSATSFNIHNFIIRDEVSLLDLVTKQGSSSNKDLQVIAVCCASSGGHGKSSIVKDTYEHEHTRAKFQRRAWVNLNAPFDAKGLLHSIAMQFEANKYQKDGHAYFLNRVTQGDWNPDFTKYQDDMYLLVIDGLSTITEWYLVRALLPNKAENGSWIIVSTMQQEVASLCVERPYKVSLVKHEQCDHPIHIFFREDYRFIVGSGSTRRNISMDTIIEFITSPDDSEPGKVKRRSSSAAASSSYDSKSEKKNLKLLLQTRMAPDPEGKLSGRNVEADFMVRRLITEGREQLAVVSVWGQHGMGKTALALIFSRTRDAREHFSACGFVTVYHGSDVNDIFRRLAVDVRDRQGTSTSSTGADELAALLREKTYLIILDGLVATTQWDDIMRVWPADEGNGSRIIVTTTAESIAQHCSIQDEDILELRALEIDPALDLFFKKASLSVQDRNDKIDSEAAHIVEACGKNPYSIAALGYYLSSSRDVELWRKQMDQLSALENYNSNEFHVAAYNSLTYRQRMFFLYFSIFPEDENIRLGRIVRRLIAEGYLRQMPRVATEVQVGEGDVKGLIDKGLIQLSTTVKNSGQNQDICLLHHDIHRMALEKSKEENLVIVLDDQCSLRMTEETVEHLTVRRNWTRVEYEFFNSVDLTVLQSLTVFGEWKSFFISDTMRSLVVLDLEDTSGLQDDDLKVIGTLLNLKYLSLRGCHTIKNLPNSVGHLRRLQTLDIRYTSVSKLPVSIASLQSLQYLRAGTVEVPEGVGKLMHLETLSVVYLGASTRSNILHGIKKLGGLRKLGVDGLSQRNCNEFCKALSELKLLQSLSVKSHMGQEDLSVLFDSMQTAPKRLEHLKLHGRLGRLPEWIMPLEKLERLTLRSTELRLEDMGRLGQLKKLKMLCLCDKAFLSSDIRFTRGTLPQLKNLHLVRLRDPINSVTFEEGAMPKLEQLVVIEASGSTLRIDGNEFLSHARKTSISSGADLPF